MYKNTANGKAVCTIPVCATSQVYLWTEKKKKLNVALLFTIIFFLKQKLISFL